MSKFSVRAVKAIQALSGTGLRGRLVAGFLSGVLRLIRPRHERIDSNLRLVYPEREHNARWRSKIRTQVYQNLSWTLTEILALQRDRTQALDWIIGVDGEDILDQIVANPNGTGAIIVTAHFGNWELLGSWYAQTLARKSRNTRELHVIYQKLHDRDLSAVLHEMREHTGMKVLPKEASTLDMTRMLRSGAHIATLPDVSWIGGVKLPFMGHDCTNSTGPAVLSMLSGVPIVPIAIYREAPFRHRVRFFEPLIFPQKTHRQGNDKNDRIELVMQMTLKVNATLEHMIKLQPELWFWLHNRWK